MNLSEPFIRRPVMTTLLTIALVLLGWYSYKHLPVSNLPSVDYPVINVSVSLPGASPETMANTVATPLEMQFMTIPGVKSVTSSNTFGATSIVLEFELNKNLNAAAQDVEAAISRASGRLPTNLPSPPSYQKVNPSETPIMYLALTSESMNLAELYTYGHNFIGQRLSMIEGVAQVLTYGAPYALRAQMKPQLMASQGITLDDVAKTLADASPYLPTGQLDNDRQSLIIQTQNPLQNAAGYRPLVVRYQEGAPVRLEDIGDVVDSLDNTRIELRYIDQEKSVPTVVLAVARQPGANTVEVSKLVKEHLPKLMEQLPASVELHVQFDMAQSILESIAEVKLTLVVALLLVVLVIFIYLGNPTDTIIPSLAMPISILATFWVMSFFGYSIDNLSLLALILATGFIVDDAIVVLENIVRRIEGGESRLEASLKGSAQICFTILSMTLSLIAVFIPLLFMGGLIGKILQEFSMTLVIVVLASGVISLTLTPLLCSRFVAVKKTGALNRLSDGMNRFFLYYYEQSLTWAMQHRGWILGLGTLSVILSGILFVKLPKDFMPDDDIGFIIGFTMGAEGTSADEMARYQTKVNEVLRTNPYVNTFVSLTGFPQTRQGLVFARLIPHEERPSSQEIIQSLYPQLGEIAGVNTFLKNVPLIDLSVGSNNRGTYQYQLQSLNTEVLYAAAEEMEERMKALPGYQGVSSDLEIKTPQLNVKVDRDRAATFGLTEKQVEVAFLHAYSGNRVTRIQTPYDQYDVIVEVEPGAREWAEQLGWLHLRSPLTGDLVPLEALAAWQEGVGVSSVQHASQFPAVTLSFDLAPGYALGPALEALRALATEVLPPQVMGGVEGTAQTFEESVKDIVWLIILAIAAIYLVLGILYESYVHPITILSSLPPAVLGGLLILKLLGLPLSLYAYLGIILLIGIVKKNGIMVVDYALEYQRHAGESALKAAHHAALVRFRPIMMTTLCAVMGALPIAFGWGAGADARRPLGLVIIGGMVLSQIVTLYLIPVMYTVMSRYSKPSS